MNEPIQIAPELLDKVNVWRDVMRTMRDDDLPFLHSLVSLEMKQRAEWKQKVEVEVERRETDV